MNKKRVSLIVLSSLTLGLTISSVFVGRSKSLITFGYTNGDAATYYNSINSSMKNDALLSALQSLNSSRKKSSISYNSMMNYFKQTDPGTSSGKITSFYSGQSVSTSQCNKEHVWPNSHGGDVVENDIHMVRPTLSSENEGRGNSFYVEGMNDQYNGWDPANCGVPSYRGDSARIIFYCVVAYSGFELLDVNKHHTTSEDNDYKMGKLSDLLKWNLQYPVLQREKTRNEAAEKLQGNRNPFIDHPEYACRIWGNYNSTTKQICGYDHVSEFSLASNSIRTEVDKMFRIDYTLEPEELENTVTITWSSSNPDVASVSLSGLISTLTPGTTTITATIIQYNISDTCVLTVTKAGGGSSKGCGGNIIATSAILSTLSIIGVSLLLIRKRYL